MWQPSEFHNSRNRVGCMGAALEEYTKDVFAGTINERGKQRRLRRLEEAFSYTVNQNNPPLIIRGDDAIEAKKIENTGSHLALNSSCPKAKLFAGNRMIMNACRTCEDWNEKDITFAIGVVNGRKLLPKR